MRLEIYKRGQGKYTRLCSAFGGLAVAGLGCVQLYKQLEARTTNLWLMTMVPAGLLVVLSILIFYLVNRASVADFMISAEGEMKKVSWSSRKEIAVSTFIVIVVVFVMAGLLGGSDLVFLLFFDWILV